MINSKIVSEKKIIIKVDLDGKYIEKFLEIKDYSNIKKNAEVLRFCLGEAHRLMLRRKKIEEVTEDYKE